MATPKTGNPPGRPTRYNKTLHPSFVYQLARMGKTNVEIAEILEISTGTLHTWEKKYPEFLSAKKAGKKEPDDQVEKALFDRAIGYSHPEEKVHFDKYGDVHTYQTMRHYPPDTAAAFIWLKNRRPERWRDKQEIEHSGGVTFEAPKALDD